MVANEREAFCDRGPHADVWGGQRGHSPPSSLSEAKGVKGSRVPGLPVERGHPHMEEVGRPRWCIPDACERSRRDGLGYAVVEIDPTGGHLNP